MALSSKDQQRAGNLWDAFARKYPPLLKATQLSVAPEVSFDAIGGLGGAKDDVLTYACAVTAPDVYAHWGTYPSPALLLVGPPSCGKTLLAQALATHTEMAFLEVGVPRLVLQVLQAPKQIPEILDAWGNTLEEMPPTTVFFEELEFTQQAALGGVRLELPIVPLMEFLLDLIDRAIVADGAQVVGSTSYPDKLRPAMLDAGRFERVVAVRPVFPDDISEALQIHAEAAEARAGRPLFKDVDWTDVVRRHREASIGDWVRLLHAVLRSKARCEAGDLLAEPVGTSDLVAEVERSSRLTNQLPHHSGRYL